MNTTEALAPFDIEERKGFSYLDIDTALSAVDESEKAKQEYGYETTAMSLMPTSDNNPWGNYFYGPFATLTTEEGTPIYLPALENITPEAISYWESRASSCKNPLLVTRYSGLVWDFKTKIARQKQRNWMYLHYLANGLRVCREDYCNDPYLIVIVLEHLFTISVNSPDNLQAIKEVFADYEKRHSGENIVCIWASRFRLMLEHKKRFTEDEINAIVAEHENRLTSLCAANNDPWIIKQQAELLARYYHSTSQKEEVRRVLLTVEDSFMKQKESIAALALMGNLDAICKLYSHYQLDDERKRLSATLQSLAPRVKEEMKPIRMEFDIPRDVYVQADFLFGDKAESEKVRWENFVAYFIPNMHREEETLKEHARQYPLIFMAGNWHLDPKGHPTNQLGSYEDDPKGHLMIHVAQNLQLESYFLAAAISHLLDTNTLTVDNVMRDFITKSPIYEKSRYEIVREAIDLFIHQKYVLFCHLIVPQIEHAICNLVEMSGVSILKPQRDSKGYQIRTLDDLLRDKCVEETLGTDTALYLQVVLTNQRGLNIRNLLCHGILDPECFSPNSAWKLFHVMVLLGHVRVLK